MDVPLMVRDELCPTGYEPLTINTKTGVRRYYRRIGEEEAHIISVQPVEHILKANADEKYHGRGRLTQRGQWGALAARIDATTLNEMRYHADGTRLDEDDYQARITRFLNDSDYSKFRVGEFTV